MDGIVNYVSTEPVVDVRAEVVMDYGYYYSRSTRLDNAIANTIP